MRAVFLDRDGTLVRERGYVTAPEMVEVLPGVPEALVLMRGAGWKLFVVTNQACVAKGLVTEDELAGIHQRLVAMLGAEGALLDGIYFCPHHPDGSVPDYAIECACRKPRAGLLEQAAREHHLDLAACVMVGDTQRDLDAGRAAGTRTVLVRTGKGAALTPDPGPDHAAADLLAAAGWIVGTPAC
jgi:D-glycero-D-manno-heptose 1,7-bisphosphate phosphatase